MKKISLLSLAGIGLGITTLVYDMVKSEKEKAELKEEIKEELRDEFKTMNYTNLEESE